MPRLEKTIRKERLISAGLHLARKHGYRHVTRVMLAAHCGVSEALVSAHFGTMKQFTRDIMRHAIMDSDCVIVAQGLAANDPFAKKAPLQLRTQAAASIV